MYLVQHGGVLGFIAGANGGWNLASKLSTKMLWVTHFIATAPQVVTSCSYYTTT